ncbi:MAG TPA: SLBB domain-containing protein [Cellvibrionaceae bacterium]
MKRFTYGLFILLMNAGACLAAQPLMPSPAQIEQFKSLSAEEKQALAKSVGIDPTSIGANSAQPQIREAETTRRTPTDQTNPMLEGSKSIGGNKPLDNDEKKLNKTQLDESSDENQAAETKKSTTDEAVILKPFGADLFTNGPATFTPASDIPIPADYVMGPGDNIVIQLYGKENNAYSLTINREGQVQFPQIGPINLAGLSFSQAQTNLSEVVEKQMIGVKSSVTMGALRTIRIFVLGEVVQPGSFTVGALSTMTNALFASGGINKVGSFRNIQLKRQGKVVTSLDLYDLLLRGDTSEDARLMPGDVLFVPPVGETITVMGAVTRPAIYELRNSTDVSGALSLAGGASTAAYLPESRLQRIGNSGEKTLINLDLTKARDKAQPIKDGDVLKISSVLDIVQDKVTLKGHVKRAEEFAWTRGARFSDAIPNVDALLPNPDIDVALIQREMPGTRQIQTLLVSPKAAWANRGGNKDPLLQSNDTLFIFNFDDDRSDLLQDTIERLKTQSQFQERQKTVGISGSVRFPGVYPQSEQMSAQDLILLAGGLTESALGTQGEITRYDISQNMERVVMHVAVDLNDPRVQLQPADTLQIKQVPLWKNKESVTIEGEVMFPGTYSILPGETLMDVLTRAGGLTPHAHSEGAVFSRKELRELEEARIQDMKKTIESELVAASATQQTGKKNIDTAEAQRILKSLEGSKAGGRLVIDLPLILRTPTGHDFQLEDGDRLNVPRFKPSVTVVGEVQFPTSHFYNAKLDAWDYINNSGGTKKNADTSRIYVVKANGTVVSPKSGWVRTTKRNVQPGDTIVVPLETDKKDTLEIFAKASSIIYNSALGAAALAAIK